MPVEISDLHGLWHRSLLVRPDGTRDTSTWVAWLQGPSFYADLRLPAGRPSFHGVCCRNDITASQLTWLARQEGFAGRLERDGAFFVWRRALDFQPEALAADAGALRLEGGIMIEEGRDIAYVEHWHPQTEPTPPLCAVRLRDRETGRGGFMVRAGTSFMYARAGAAASLPPGLSLGACVESAGSLARAQELVDCEISLGRVGPEGWLIARSTLPYREGARLDPETRRQSPDRCRTGDVTPDGAPASRDWEIMELEGDAAAASTVA